MLRSGTTSGSSRTYNHEHLAGTPSESGSHARRISNPWKVGAHVSSAGGVENSVKNAAAIG
jgi:hypothetical protein